MRHWAWVLCFSVIASSIFAQQFLSKADGVNAPEAILLPARTLDPDMIEIEVGGRVIQGAVQSVEFHSDSRTVRFYAEGSKSLSTVTFGSHGQKVGYVQISDHESYYLTPGSPAVNLSRGAFQDLWCETKQAEEVRISSAIESSSAKGRRRAVRSGSELEVVDIRIAMWYHPRFTEEVGGEENVRLIHQNAVDGWNSALLESGQTGIRGIYVGSWPIGTVQGLTATPRPDYSETLDLSGSLSRFAHDVDINQFRYENQVSVAFYWDMAWYGGGGVAFLYSQQAANFADGHAVLFWGPTTVPGTFNHEIGHLLGLAHGKWEEPDPNFCQKCFAWRDCDHRMRDVMAGGQCLSDRSFWYSNPLRTVNGIKVGSEESDGVSVLRQNRYAARDFWKAARQE